MNLLLDTHVLLWALADDPLLSERARDLIEDSRNEVYYSAISSWEVEIKHAAHPDKMAATARQIIEWCDASGYSPLPVRATHAQGLSDLRRPPGVPDHRDPFDRMLICQAIAENMLLLTHDRRVAEYDDPRVCLI